MILSHICSSFCRVHSLGMVGCGVLIQLPHDIKVLPVTIICLKGQLGLGIQKLLHFTEYKI